MSTVRVTLNTGQTHEVEVTPDTVVSFKTDVGTGDGRTLTDLKAWCDIATIETVAALDVSTLVVPFTTPETLESPVPEDENHDALMRHTRAELDEIAKSHGVANPEAFATKGELVGALVAAEAEGV